MHKEAALIEKQVVKGFLKDVTADRDLAYWLSKTPAERIAAVEELRRHYHGDTERLQRSVRVIRREPR